MQLRNCAFEGRLCNIETRVSTFTPLAGLALPKTPIHMSIQFLIVTSSPALQAKG